MSSNLIEENLNLKKRLIESQMLILEYQMREIQQEIEHFNTSKKEEKEDVS